MARRAPAASAVAPAAATPAAAPADVPAADTRERLLQAGLALAQRQGVRAITVRAVSTEAGTNLGSFVYHFGTREAFVDLLLERWYAPLFAQLQPLASAPGDPLLALRRLLLQLVQWLATHRAFIAQLLLDAASGEAGAVRFLQSLEQRHPALVLQCIAQAQAAGRLQRAEPMQQVLFLMGAVAVPVLVFHLLGRQQLAPQAMVEALSQLSTDPAAVAQRLDWALRGMAPGTDAGGDAASQATTVATRAASREAAGARPPRLRRS